MTATNNDKAINQYLSRHAEPEASLALQLDWPDNQPCYRHCLVVPACRETLTSLNRIWPHDDPQMLQILIINSADIEDQQSRELLGQLTCNVSQQRENLYLVTDGNGPDRLIIDRCSPSLLIPPREGVGLARKIGADIALALHCAGHIDSALINTTDADVTLPADYFDHPSASATTAALCRPFMHIADTHLEMASQLYETSMHYYVLGLRAAGSPYAYHAIGSTLSIHAPHYARARGFPRRNAGEDFYLLNKLAKLGNIHSCRGNRPGEGMIKIDARLSDRAPFGTGSALAKISAFEQPLAQYLFYHPGVFEQLGIFHQRAARLQHESSGAVFSDTPMLAEWAANSGLDAVLRRQDYAQQPDHVFQRLLLDWFDGFRTLKLIHFLRDHHLPSQPLATICNGQLLPAQTMTEAADLRRLHRWLRQQLWGTVE